VLLYPRYCSSIIGEAWIRLEIVALDERYENICRRSSAGILVKGSMMVGITFSGSGADSRSVCKVELSDVAMKGRRMGLLCGKR
jgi:hypothetical protein